MYQGIQDLMKLLSSDTKKKYSHQETILIKCKRALNDKLNCLSK